MIVIKENKKVKILSRNNIDYTSKFKKICESIKSIDDNFIIDGEIVSFDENGRSDFKLLQENLKNKNNEFYYVIFDLLAIDNNDLRTLPLIKRKEKLKRLLYECESNLIYSKHVDKGLESFKFAKENNLEGIIAKKKDAPYIEKRSSDWLKIKCYLRQEFIIVGFITTEKNKMLSALVLGYYDSNKKLQYVGKVGTGFNEKQRSELNEKFNKIRRKTSPLKEEVNLKNINWLTPKYVCEIKFAEFTKDKLLRQPSFISLRNDKNPKEVILEFNNEKH